jgi:hypothetical protein
MSVSNVVRHAGGDPASSPAFGGIEKDWIPAFAGMTILIEGNIFNGNPDEVESSKYPYWALLIAN